MTRFQNSKPVYDLEGRPFEFWKNQSDINSKVQTCFGHSILKFGIYPSIELRVVSPSTLLRTVSLSNGLSNHLEFSACILELNSSL